MKRHYLLILLLATLSFTRPAPNPHNGWTSLFNGKNLEGWDVYLKGAGLNPASQQVFTVTDKATEKCIRVSGEITGGLSTQKEYKNYHLQLLFKWGSYTWGSKKGKKKDSGLLYHSVGAYGADNGAWMRSQEFQVEETNTGDNEKTTGEWNTLDLYCHGDTAVHVVNGKTMMILYHCAQADKGQLSPLTAGKIQLQSEGAEVFYKHIRIQSITQLPAEILSK